MWEDIRFLLTAPGPRIGFAVLFGILAGAAAGGWIIRSVVEYLEGRLVADVHGKIRARRVAIRATLRAVRCGLIPVPRIH